MNKEYKFKKEYERDTYVSNDGKHWTKVEENEYKDYPKVKDLEEWNKKTKK